MARCKGVCNRIPNKRSYIGRIFRKTEKIIKKCGECEYRLETNELNCQCCGNPLKFVSGSQLTAIEERNE